MKSLLIFSFLMIVTATAQAAQCRVSQTSKGDYGVREFRASGWVYIVRGLTYADAQRALERYQAFGRCN